MLHVLFSLAIFALLVGGFRFCVSLYRDMKRPYDYWKTSPDNPAWNPDHPQWDEFKAEVKRRQLEKSQKATAK